MILGHHRAAALLSHSPHALLTINTVRALYPLSEDVQSPETTHDGAWKEILSAFSSSPPRGSPHVENHNTDAGQATPIAENLWPENSESYAQ